MFGSHFEIQDGCLSLIKLTNIILTVAAKTRAKELDFQFMRDMNASTDCPEYHGYNTTVCREQGHILKRKTSIVYLSLIYKAPADPATIMSDMLKALAVTETTGQEYVVFTTDQQLCRVAVHVMWENQVLFGNIYLRLGGMHLLSYAQLSSAPELCRLHRFSDGWSRRSVVS